MQLFEILQDGFHTPLTATEVAELFHAGRLSRHTRCKPAKQREWRTVDELFPLLKYHAPLQFSYESPDSNSEFRFRRSVVIALSFFGAAAATIVIYLYFQSQNPDRQIISIDSTSAARPHAGRGPVFTPQPIQSTVYASTASPFYSSNALPVVTPPVEPMQPQAAIPSAEAQRINDQARADQAIAEQQRVMHEQKLLEQQKAAGKDQQVLLDQWQSVNLGGYSVSVKIHDNDTTSFDVWINGAHYPEVKKQKGITGSGTDETFIYSNGRAALYYVWEISGKLDHCLLRVRDS